MLGVSHIVCFFQLFFKGFVLCFITLSKLKSYKILAALLKLQCVNISFEHIDNLKTILIIMGKNRC